ncbi:MAG: hypothetical protein DRJ03_00405 [Chloroflexi bacterium]|nr:MAG: hypothetical protein DRJ03_00405 [Chloroflexota bacterium]
MASVVYDNKAIIPAPLVSVSKVYRTAGDGGKHGVGYEISLAGTILPFRGSPSGSYPLGDPSDAFWTLGDYPPDETYTGGDVPFVRLERKQEALRWLFREDGKVLEWYGGAGSPVKCRPKVRSIVFPEGQWADRCDYRVELEAEYLTGIIDEDIFDASGLQDVSEEWQFSEVAGHDGKVYEIHHIVSAKGLLTFDEVTGTETQAWDNAKGWCDSRIAGVPDSSFVTYATSFADWVNGSYTKGMNVSERDGSYAVTETWVIREAGPGEVSATYSEKSFTVIHRSEDETVDVTYNGTIYGLQDQSRTGSSSAIANAKAEIPTNVEAKAATETALGTLLEGYVIPVSPTQKNITINEKDAVVTFGFNWSASEDADYVQGNEATLTYNAADGVYTLVLNVDIEGKGDTKTERLNNARSNIPSDVDARALAQTLIGSQKPAGVTFVGTHVAKTSALNETRGSSRTSWTWTDKDENNVDITVDIAYPQIMAAKLFIPGRIAGPIIQRINTATAQQVSVSYRSEGHGSTKPDTDTVADTMDDAGGVPYGPMISPWYPGSYILESDHEVWNPTTGKYSRTRVHTVTESGA